MKASAGPAYRISSQQYEPHVDGLRAVAVLAVLLFHLGVPGFQGGYSGVDVFFVISGYLITRKIVSEVEATGRFRFGHFYMARLRRIFPALLATLVLTVLAAGLLLPGPAAQRVGNEGVAALLSVSNILFWLQSGYFDAASDSKALLHTWSLGVEEQFYFVWPAVILGLAVLRPGRALWAGLVALGAASLSANILVVWFRPGWLHEPISAMFFLMPFRVYEFAIGAAGVWLVREMPLSRTVQEAAMLFGLVLIAWTVVLLPAEVPWPSWWALGPCVGALLVILAARATFVGSMLTNPVAVGIGLISYSLYLVHWPIIVFYRNLTFREPSPAAAAAMLAASIGLAFLFYRFIEQPARRKTSWLFPTRRFAPVVAAGAVITVALASALATGFLGRDAGLTAEQIQGGKSARFDLIRKGCRIDKIDSSERCHMDRPLQVLVFGNSHEPDAYNSLATLYGDADDVNLIYFSTINRCDLTLDEAGIHSSANHAECPARAAVLNRPDFLENIDIVVLGQNDPFGAYAREAWAVLKWMQTRNPNITFVVMGPYLNLSADCPDLANRFGTLDVCKAKENVTVADFDGPKTNQVPEADTLDFLFIDEMALLCPEGTLKSCIVETDGEPFSYDMHHRSLPLSRLIARRMAESYGADLEKIGFPPVGR
ncbi:acyltransferase [Methyloceanibacter sp. wino2]|uniref:acyltransferase family protein n=1 Tax=Methyloceanibacter sp. wino2 TaxID=2170729 RepID=UPI00131F34BB|nr:acyltransferase [Methyloceanibacter sp. wino2]